MADSVERKAPEGSDRQPLCRIDFSVMCPQCQIEMAPVHSHYQCPKCGWRDSCCF